MERHGISVSDEAKDLILKLLVKDKNNRLGVNGGDEVLAHPFFASIAMDKLIEKKIKAPFLPQTHDPDKMKRS